MKHMNNTNASRGRLKQLSRVGILGLVVLFTTACHLEMYDQPKQAPLSSSQFFGDGSSARPLVEGAVPRGVSVTTPLATGREGGAPEGAFLSEFPAEITVDANVLARGEERFAIYCATCHGANGNGRAAVANLLNPRPPSFYDARLVEMPVGQYFHTITNGQGTMYPYGSKIQDPADRWAIIAWIRELQKNPPAEGQ
jgi:mono/diheme cytochrome c family protein